MGIAHRSDACEAVGFNPVSLNDRRRAVPTADSRKAVLGAVISDQKWRSALHPHTDPGTTVLVAFVSSYERGRSLPDADPGADIVMAIVVFDQRGGGPASDASPKILVAAIAGHLRSRPVGNPDASAHVSKNPVIQNFRMISRSGEPNPRAPVVPHQAIFDDCRDSVDFDGGPLLACSHRSSFVRKVFSPGDPVFLELFRIEFSRSRHRESVEDGSFL